MMIKTLKIKLKPNNKQQTKMFQFCGAKRFAYNWALAREQENYKNGNKFISDCELRKEFTKLKKQEEYKWLYSISNDVTKQAIKDACLAYKRFFKGQSAFPKFKSKKHDTQSFYVDNVKIKFTETHVKLENIATSKKRNKAKLNWVRLVERNKIPTDCKYSNPHVIYDGLNWFICVGVECEDNTEISFNEGIGIDLGIKDLAICSNKVTYKNINKTQNIKRLEKRKRRLQRKISKKYLINKKGVSYCKTCNIIKSERKLLKLNKRLTNIRDNYLHQVTSDIIKRNPSFVTIEDLNVSGMMKNKHLSKAVAQQKFYEFRRQLEYKCKWNNIELRIVDRYYPSSKLCHECGAIKKDLKLSDRTYVCKECGCIIDRDYNASLNLRDCKTYKIA